MIRLTDDDLKNNNYQSSKGNQLKWRTNTVWYKADYAGYEGLAEYMVSSLLRYSNIDNRNYIIYKTEEISYKNTVYRGCSSEHFLPDGWQLITLERLFKNIYGESLYKSIFTMSGVKTRAEFLTEQVEKLTGLTDFGSYLCCLLTIDALFLNEDRHMHNIGVLHDEYGVYHYCPVFDNGCSLMSDTTMDYPMHGDIVDMIPQVKAKTLCADFMEQLDAVEQLYGQSVRFWYDERVINSLLDKEMYYPEEVKYRVKEILLQQRRTYGYLFGR